MKLRIVEIVNIAHMLHWLQSAWSFFANKTHGLEQITYQYNSMTMSEHYEPKTEEEMNNNNGDEKDNDEKIEHVIDKVQLTEVNNNIATGRNTNLSVWWWWTIAW